MSYRSSPAFTKCESEIRVCEICDTPRICQKGKSFCALTGEFIASPPVEIANSLLNTSRELTNLMKENSLKRDSQIKQLKDALIDMIKGYRSEVNPYSIGGFYRDLDKDECMVNALAALSSSPTNKTIAEVLPPLPPRPFVVEDDEPPAPDPRDAEIERLRGALQQIARGRRVDWDAINFSYEALDEDEAREIARATLKENSDGH